MSKAIDNLESAMKRAVAVRPKVGGFPYLAETLRLAGVKRNIWFLPSCESVYVTDLGPIVNQGTPLVSGMTDIPSFDEGALIAALRKDQAGNSTFAEFLISSWKAGVVRYEVDFLNRTVSYYGVNNETFIESYSAVKV